MDRTRQYFTLVYGAYDGASGRFRYVVAGHPAPILVPAAGPPVPLDGKGLPIGMFEESIYQEETVTLEPGDRLYFYTDGVIEATDAAQVELGSARLMAELDRVRAPPPEERARGRRGDRLRLVGRRPGGRRLAPGDRAGRGALGRRGRVIAFFAGEPDHGEPEHSLQSR